MAIGSAGFAPSVIEDGIYNLINCADFIVSSKEYTEKCMRAVESFLMSCRVKWNCIWDSYPDESGASVSFAWIECGELHHIVLNVRYDASVRRRMKNENNENWLFHHSSGPDV